MNTNTNITFGAVAASVLAAISAGAATQSYTSVWSNSYDGNVTGGAVMTFTGSTVTVPQWDSSAFVGYVLTGVSYVVEGASYGDYAFNNSGGSAANYSASGTGISITAVSPFGGAPTVTAQPSFAKTFLALNPGVDQIGVTDPGFNVSPSSSDNANLANYIGVGLVSFTVAGDGFFGVNGSGSVGTIPGNNLIDGIGSGRVTVTYTYDLPQVPEASTYAAVGFMGFAAFGVYRRARK